MGRKTEQRTSISIFTGTNLEDFCRLLGLGCLGLKKDQYHSQARAQHYKMGKLGFTYITSDYVLGETFSFLYRVSPPHQVRNYINAILDKADAGE